MKPAVFVSLSLFLLVYVGNACMKSNFKTAQVLDSSIKVASCAADEADLNRHFLADARIGYIGDRKVSYAPFDESHVLVDGDMLIPVKGGALPSKPLPRGISQGVGAPQGQLWPQGRIPYSLPLDFPERNRIVDAIQEWNSKLAGVIEFVPRADEVHYVGFVEVAAGCSAVVGFQANGVHRVNLERGCSTGNVIHELGHIIGLQHEQNRLDRDQYVRIEMENVRPEFRPNFQIDWSFRNLVQYDFGSIMHYKLRQFGIVDPGSSVERQTIFPISQDVDTGIIGQRAGLSRGDINSVRVMYNHPILVEVDPGSGAVSPPPSGPNGLAGHYFQRNDFTDLRASQLDSAVNFDWGTGAPHSRISGSNFSARWKGWLFIPSQGEYKFSVRSTGGYRVEMDGAAIFDRMTNAEDTTFVSRVYTLSAGQRIRINVDYVANSTDNSIALSWTRPDGTNQPIPTDVFYALEDEINYLDNICTQAASN